MLGTIVEKVQSLFSKGFLLGAYFPVLIFAVVNALIAFFGLAPSFEFLGTLNHWWAGLGQWQAVVTGALLIAIGIAAYLLSTLVDVIRRLIEGRYLASWPLIGELVMRPVRMDRGAKQTALENARTVLRRRLRENGNYKTRLDNAVQQGNQPNVPGNAALVDAAETSVNSVRILDLDNAGYDTALAAAVAALEAALQVNRMENPTAAQRDSAERLGVAYRGVTAETARWTAQVRQKFDSAAVALNNSYVPEDLYPTRLGNIRAVAESYSAKAYGVDFEYLWPRMQPVVLKNEKMASLIELAKARLDFALLALSLAAMTTAFWLVVLPIFGRSPWPFLVVGVLGPGTIAFCYLLVEESQILFGALAQACVDIFRLDVLPAMHQPLPDTLSAERLRWGDLQRLSGASGTIDLRLNHPSS